MTSILQGRCFILIAYAMLFTLMGEQTVAVAIFRPSKWSLAHATFYGDETASETMGIYIHLYVISIIITFSFFFEGLNYHYFSLCLNHFNINSA